jgi:hypothetical protein
LLHDELDGGAVSENLSASVGSECQRVSMETDVAEAFQVARIVCDHGRSDGKFHAWSG